RRDGDLVGQVLLAAIAVSLAAFLVTERVVDASSAREIAPVLPFAAAVLARARREGAFPGAPPYPAAIAGPQAGRGDRAGAPAAPGRVPARRDRYRLPRRARP